MPGRRVDCLYNDECKSSTSLSENKSKTSALTALELLRQQGNPLQKGDGLVLQRQEDDEGPQIKAKYLILMSLGARHFEQAEDGTLIQQIESSHQKSVIEDALAQIQTDPDLQDIKTVALALHQGDAFKRSNNKNNEHSLQAYALSSLNNLKSALQELGGTETAKKLDKVYNCDH